jgi:hypothetical protein
MVGMNTPNRLHDRAAEVLEAAQTFRAAAGEPGSHAAATASLERLEEALQVLSAAWYQLAADASPGIVDRRLGHDSKAASWPSVDGLSREQEVRLLGTLHDIAAAFARCSRTCREARSTVTPIIAGRVAAGRGDDRGQGSRFPRFKRHERPGQRVA